MALVYIGGGVFLDAAKVDWVIDCTQAGFKTGIPFWAQEIVGDRTVMRPWRRARWPGWVRSLVGYEGDKVFHSTSFCDDIVKQQAIQQGLDPVVVIETMATHAAPYAGHVQTAIAKQQHPGLGSTTRRSTLERSPYIRATDESQ